MRYSLNQFTILASLFCVAVPATDLKWESHGTLLSAQLSVGGDQPGFILQSPAATGLLFTNSVDEWSGAANRVLYNGSGVALGDYDGDGRLDIYLCRLQGPNALFRNLGNWKFAEMTAMAGVECRGTQSRGAVFADLNGDGRLDLLVSTLGRGVLCFTNSGNGRFTEISVAAGTLAPYGSSTLTLADVDGNSTLDLYVANNRTDDIRDRGQIDLRIVNGRPVIPAQFRDRLVLTPDGQILERGEPDILFLNDGNARFKPVPWDNGTFLDEQGRKLSGPPLDWALSASFRDLNGDSWPDLYVCNDFWTPDRIWMNDGTGRFRAVSTSAIRSISASSMGVDFADIDRDGDDEIFVVDMLSRDVRLRNRQNFAQKPMPGPIGAIDHRPQIMRNTLFDNRGDGTFAEIANFAGVAAAEWAWSPVFLDVDLDGYEDILITAGHFKDVQDLDAQKAIRARQHSWAGYTNQVERQKAFTQELMEHLRLYPDLRAPIVAYRNLGNRRFEETTGIWGTDQAGVHHGIAIGDLDNDGDLDFVVNNLGSGAGLYRNNSSKPRVTVRLKGARGNTQAIGAKVILRGGAVSYQSQEMMAGGRYLSGSDTAVTFASASGPMSLEVIWRDGTRNRFENLQSNRAYEVSEQSSKKEVQPPAAAPARTWFADISARLAHAHIETPFDDFARQPLLPKKLSQQGPGVAWLDFDGDGDDDLVLGSGKGGTLGIFRNDSGHFARLTNGLATAPVTRDTTGFAAARLRGPLPELLAASSNYEDGLARGAAVRLLNLQTISSQDAVLADAASAGPLALGDVDGDNQLELFVGGSVVPGKYPAAASSRIFDWTGKTFELDQQRTAKLEKIGLVNGVLWCDLTGDGAQELVLACEWGPVRVFQNRADELEEITGPLGLADHTGLWSGLATGDFNNDGMTDLVVGNWGLNSHWRASPEQPLRFYSGDLNGDGIIEIVETAFQGGAAYPVGLADAMLNAFPFLNAKFTTFEVMTALPFEKFFSDQRTQLAESTVSTIATTVFLNRAGRFEAIPLPDEAQFAPVFGVNVADFDGDGNHDMFLAQNFFATRPEVPRLDGGRGLLLRGNGTGKFEPVPGHVSGLQIYGEQRGSAVADFDGDGRADLVVTQNGAETRLFHNKGARPGLRVSLAGPRGNPSGIGAVIRLHSPAGPGPVHVVHGGGGYFSQDSFITVLAAKSAPDLLSVRWSDGTKSEVKVTGDLQEIVIRHSEARSSD